MIFCLKRTKIYVNIQSKKLNVLRHLCNDFVYISLNDILAQYIRASSSGLCRAERRGFEFRSYRKLVIVSV